jgi:alpha-glucosidase
MARRDDQDWYIGAMPDWEPRSINLRLDFLEDIPYNAQIYSDDPLTDTNPASLLIRDITVSATDTITVEMASGGGCVVHLTPVL